MWITSLCGFSPLFQGVPLPLERTGASISQPFTVSVDKKYPLEVGFEFPSTDARIKDEIIGYRYDQNCHGNRKFKDIPEQERIGLGRPIPFKVIVRRKSNQEVVIDRTFESLCVSSHVDNKKWRTIGLVELTRGEYIAEVTSLEAQSGLEGIKTTISLVAGHGK